MRAFGTLVALSLLAACSGGQPGESTSPPAAEAFAPPLEGSAAPPASDAAGGGTPLPVTLPQLAYRYRIGFVLPQSKIADAQRQHLAQCEALGAAKCQMIALSSGSADGSAGDATLKLRVASGDARRFVDTATATVAKAGGRAADTNVEAEDVSKDIVDAQARIRQRTLLVDRLTEILRTRKGTVAELVEAERSVAQAQEELDKANGWLAELRGRVAMSDMEIHYSAVAPSADPGTVGSQMKEAVAGSASGFLLGLRFIAILLIFLAPWAVVFGLLFLFVRSIRNARRRNAAATDSSDA